MSDPLGLIGNLGAAAKSGAMSLRTGAAGPAGAESQGPGFRALLQEQIEKVNQLQNDATVAMEDLAAGRRDDLESVIIATQKADIAFKMLLQVRNKVMEAYEEVKQIRV